MLSFKCSICDANFPKEKLDGKGRCPVCAQQYPDASNKLEALGIKPQELTKTLSEEEIRKIVREELNAIHAEKKAAAMEKAREIKAAKAKK